MGALWVSEFCGQAELVVKTDDDQYADLYEVKYLTKFVSPDWKVESYRSSYSSNKREH